ncbi:MAG: helix-turn-helix domain-containing protein [Desulfovibrio sp.]|jgi:predicted transcriptional regulator|nr:helix-turn-helix domain-containing protein [Desulfovibrio sp.]
MSDCNLAEIVGKNISERRKKLGISQKELAVALGITQEAMMRMEKGKIAPKMSRISDLSAKLQCSSACLFRQYNPATEKLAENIAEVLGELPADGQKTVLELVVYVVQAMSKQSAKA